MRPISGGFGIRTAGLLVLFAIVLGACSSAAPSAAASPAPSAAASAAASGAGQASSPAGPSGETSSPASPSGAGGILGAKTIHFRVTLTVAGTSRGSYTYDAKNVDEISHAYKWGRPANFLMRIEHTDATGTVTTTVVDAPRQRAWVRSGGQWQEVSAGFAVAFDALNTDWLGFFERLKGWSGSGDLTYEANGTTFSILDVQVDPTLSGSLFGPD